MDQNTSKNLCVFLPPKYTKYVIDKVLAVIFFISFTYHSKPSE